MFCARREVTHINTRMFVEVIEHDGTYRMGASLISRCTPSFLHSAVQNLSY